MKEHRGMKHICVALALIIVATTILPARDFTVFDIVGDSVSAGVNPDYYAPYKNYGWAHILFGEGGGSLPPPVADTITSLWPGIVKYNSAISGSKASGWAATPSAPMTTVLGHHPDLVVVMIGGNDLLAFGADGIVTQQEMEAYRQDLDTIITRLQANTPRPEVILVDYYDLADGYSANLSPYLATYRGLSQAVLQGNQVIHDVAGAKGARLVSIYDAFLHHAYGGELGDTGHLAPDYFRMPLSAFDIHPITAGHAAIHALVYQKLLELKTEPVKAQAWVLY